MVRKEVIKVSLISLIILIMITSSVVLLLKWDSNRLSGYEEDSVPIGVAKAKEECANEGNTKEVCDQITGSASTSECDGRPCWLVYAKSSDEYAFSASVTVAKREGKYVAVKYLRNTVERP